MIQVKAKFVVEDEWEALDLEHAKAEAEELAQEIRHDNAVSVEIVSVEEISE